MPMSIRMKFLSAVVALPILAVALHRGNSASGNGGSLLDQVPVNDVPGIDTEFNTRQIRKCPVILSRPTNAQANVLVQCTMDLRMSHSIELFQNVSVSVGAAHAYESIKDAHDSQQDVTKPLYPIEGSALDVGCIYPKMCSSAPYVKAPGWCYALRANAGYRCAFWGIPDRSQFKNNVAHPMTF